MTDLLHLIEQNKLIGVFEQLYLSKVCMTVFQAYFRCLLCQGNTGSWGESIEETAYAILTLTEARRLYFF